MGIKDLTKVIYQNAPEAVKENDIKNHNQECQKLLDLMGIPWVDAPCEAEAQCAALAKAGKFIDLCILLGCDYLDSIRGIGPHKAYSLIKEHKSLERILEVIDKKKHPVPDDWPYKEARELFKNPDVTDPATIDLKWTPANEEGIVEFLCKEKGFR
ncbi:Elongation of fatty acids protein 2 [Kappamyces sp. JEL0680]|nr:Elongation of fatty acids protein 2 [Kappamyces sp. JEL0680]